MFLLSRVNNSIQQLIIYKMYQNVIPRSLRRLLDMQVLQANKEWQRSCLWNFGKVRKPWQTRPYPFEAGARKPQSNLASRVPNTCPLQTSPLRVIIVNDVIVMFWYVLNFESFRSCVKKLDCVGSCSCNHNRYIYIYYTILINILVWAM